MNALGGPWPLRLQPGDDLRAALQDAVATRGLEAAFVPDEDCELLSLGSSVGAGGSHLHATIVLPDGRGRGGHGAPACRVRTTAELQIVQARSLQSRR